MNLIHRSPRRNRLAIMRWGLKARRTCDYHYPHMDDQPMGVYAIEEVPEMLPWRSQKWDVTEAIDAYRINADSLECIPDTILHWRTAGEGKGWIITTDVPPELIELVPELGTNSARKLKKRTASSIRLSPTVVV